MNIHRNFIFFIIFIFLCIKNDLHSQDRQVYQSDLEEAISKTDAVKEDTSESTIFSEMIHETSLDDTDKEQSNGLTYNDIRGLEQKEKKTGDGFRRVSSGLLFPFRQVFNGLFFITGKSAGRWSV